MKNTMTGNRALFKVGGQIVGTGVQNVDFQTDHGLQDVDGIGSPFTQEHVPGKVVYTINMSTFFISGKDLVEKGVVPDAESILTNGTLDIEVIDAISGETLLHYSGCSAATHGMSISKHMISSENATFRALKKLR